MDDNDLIGVPLKISEVKRMIAWLDSDAASEEEEFIENFINVLKAVLQHYESQ